MRTIKRTSLPREIRYNNKIYRYDGLNKRHDSVCVEVLSSRLKGVTDLHGSQYKPTKHYFNPCKLIRKDGVTIPTLKAIEEASFIYADQLTDNEEDGANTSADFMAGAAYVLGETSI